MACNEVEQLISSKGGEVRSLRVGNVLVSSPLHFCG